MAVNLVLETPYGVGNSKHYSCNLHLISAKNHDFIDRYRGIQSLIFLGNRPS